MTNTTFLDKLAKILIENYSDNLLNTTVVFPNKRAKIFLLESLKNQATKNILSPKIISIEDFVQNISNIRPLDPINLIFEFYEIYLKINNKNQQTFEVFANWAKILLQDFNEIDLYLIDSKHILSYLKDIEDIKRWGLEVNNKTKLLEKYINFWELLPLYYETLYNHLLKKKIGYQGLIYREAVKNIDFLIESIENQNYIFAGFNALYKSEEIIIQKLINKDIAKIYWDIDSFIINDSFHEAGLFLRQFKENWSYYKSRPFKNITDDFLGSKNIKIIGTPKNIGQAKITGKIIEDIIINQKNTSLDKVAVVLGDENLLVPILNSLPDSLSSLNITMGYPAKNNPAQILIAKLFKMHIKTIARDSKNYIFYYKEILEILSHPLIDPLLNAKDLIKSINKNNYTFISYDKLIKLNRKPSDLFLTLFRKWENNPKSILETISKILFIIKENLTHDNEDEKVTKSFVYAIFKAINKLINYCSKHKEIDEIESLYAIYKQVIDLTEVPFEGEPLNGLQIMGILESRVLDFETVIITSLNEGKFPKGKSHNSFIPYDLKKEYKLPTFKEKDAIYSFHFYHLLQRAKNIYLIYNTDSDGFDSGEKSRFINQLEIEKQAIHNLTHEFFIPNLPKKGAEPITIPKSKLAMFSLKEIAKKGFSPTALTSYIRNPILFYFQKIISISKLEEVEENIELNTIGTIIHNTLEVLYTPFIGKKLTETAISECFKTLDQEVLTQFKKKYKKGEIFKGKNLLAFEVVKRNITNFLKYEIDTIKKEGEFKLLFLETYFEEIIEHPSLPFSIKIAGKTDRIEERNNTIRIVDYKTGKVEKNNLVLKTWNGLTEEIKNEKIIQILTYAFIFEKQATGKQLEAGIISLKNLKEGFLPFKFKNEKIETSIISSEILLQFKEQLVLLLNEIFNENIPFIEKM